MIKVYKQPYNLFLLLYLQKAPMDSDLSPTNRMGKTVSTEMDERTFGIFKRYKRKTSLVLSLKLLLLLFCPQVGLLWQTGPHWPGLVLGALHQWQCVSLFYAQFSPMVTLDVVIVSIYHVSSSLSSTRAIFYNSLWVSQVSPAQFIYSSSHFFVHSVFIIIIVIVNIPHQTINQQGCFVSWATRFFCFSASEVSTWRWFSGQKKKKKTAGDSVGFSLWSGINCAEYDCFRSTSLW